MSVMAIYHQRSPYDSTRKLVLTNRRDDDLQFDPQDSVTPVHQSMKFSRTIEDKVAILQDPITLVAFQAIHYEQLLVAPSCYVPLFWMISGNFA